MYPRFIRWALKARANFLAFARSAIAMAQSKLHGRVMFGLDIASTGLGTKTTTTTSLWSLSHVYYLFWKIRTC